MTKVIAVQKGPGHIGNRLTGKGYRVVDMDNTREIIDDILYLPSAMIGVSTLCANQLFAGGNNNFVFMVSRNENSEDEILYMIDGIR